MLHHPPPLSNAERQRRFQASHPGYDRRRKARQRGSGKRAVAQFIAALRAKGAEALAAEAKAAEANPQLLMLPAPVQDPVLIEMNALAASLASAPAPAREPLMVSVSQRA